VVRYLSEEAVSFKQEHTTFGSAHVLLFNPCKSPNLWKYLSLKGFRKRIQSSEDEPTMHNLSSVDGSSLENTMVIKKATQVLAGSICNNCD